MLSQSKVILNIYIFEGFPGVNVVRLRRNKYITFCQLVLYSNYVENKSLEYVNRNIHPLVYLSENISFKLVPFQIFYIFCLFMCSELLLDRAVDNNESAGKEDFVLVNIHVVVGSCQ